MSSLKFQRLEEDLGDVVLEVDDNEIVFEEGQPPLASTQEVSPPPAQINTNVHSGPTVTFNPPNTITQLQPEQA